MAKPLAHRLDDIEDGSPIRRGKPSTHSIFGVAQTINSSNYVILDALKEISKLNSPVCLRIFMGKEIYLHIS